MGRNYAKATLAPEAAAYRTIMACEPTSLTEHVDSPGMMLLLREQAAAISNGDMRQAESMLTCQATALQVLFARMTERAMAQSHMPNFEAFMRLALRAQSQCRATLETLAAIKNPPIVFARQANVTTGPQQINNGTTPSRTREIEGEQSKLLRGDHGQRMDIGTTGEAIGCDPAVETVGAIDRAKIPRGSSDCGAQCVQGRHA